MFASASPHARAASPRVTGNHKLGEATLRELTRALETNNDSRLQTLAFRNGWELPEQIKALLKRSSPEAIILPADAKVQETFSISIQLDTHVDTSSSKQMATAEILTESRAILPRWRVSAMHMAGNDGGSAFSLAGISHFFPGRVSSVGQEQNAAAEYSLRGRAVCCVPALCILCFQLAGIWQKAPMEPYLRHEVTLAATGNWSTMFLASFPLLASLLLWHGMLHAKSVAQQAFAGSGLITKEELQKAHTLAKNIGGIVFHATVGTSMLLVWIASTFGTNAKSYTSPGNYIQWMPTSFGCIAFMVVFTLSLRNLAIAVLRRENPVGARTRDATVRYIDGTFSPRIAVVVALQTVAFVHVMFFAHNTRWHTFSMKGSISDEWRGLPEVDECIRLNSTYMARYCTSTISDLDERAFMQLSQEGYRQHITAGTLRCDDGGFGVYVSKYDACESMREFAVFLVQRASTLTCMGLLLVMAVGLREIVAGLDDRLQWSAFFVPRLDFPNQCSRLLKCIVALSSAGMLLIPMLFIEATKTSASMQFLPLRTDTGPIPLVWTSYSLWLVIGVLLGIEFAVRKYQGPSTASLLSVDEEATLREALKDAGSSVRAEPNTSLHGKFPEKESQFMITGQPADAALGMAHLLHITQQELSLQTAKGVQAIVDEIEKHGTEEDKECLRYVRHDEAGSSRLIFKNSPYPRDCDEKGLRADRKTKDGKGMRISDFVKDISAKKARLTEAHVLALRLYTTSAFRRFNEPLRDLERLDPHPLAATVEILNQAIRQLRAVGAYHTPDATMKVTLWRGMKDLEVRNDFLKYGGTEMSPMSTTSNLKIAADYCSNFEGSASSEESASESSLLFKFVTPSFMLRGVDLTFLSAFPAESEFLYPPLTFMMPTGREQVIEHGQVKVIVIEATPQM